MRFDLLENGIDSLKAAGDILMEPDYYNEFQPYQIKDALFQFSHSVEILGKYLLKNDSEIRIFSNPKAYRKAVEKKKSQGLNSVYVADPKLEIIGLASALWRLKKDRKFPLGEKLWNSIDEIRLIRNEMMHYSLELDKEEFLFFVGKFQLTYAETFFYFDKNIPTFKEKVDIILRKEGLVNYQEYLNHIENLRLEIYKENWLEVQVDTMDALERNHS